MPPATHKIPAWGKIKERQLTESNAKVKDEAPTEHLAIPPKRQSSFRHNRSHFFFPSSRLQFAKVTYPGDGLEGSGGGHFDFGSGGFAF